MAEKNLLVKSRFFLLLITPTVIEQTTPTFTSDWITCFHMLNWNFFKLNESLLSPPPSVSLDDPVSLYPPVSPTVHVLIEVIVSEAVFFGS